MKKRILHVISSVSAGGIESLVVSLYENIDREKFQFDFAVFNPKNPIHKHRLEELGANIYFISEVGLKTSIISKVFCRIKAVINYNRLIKSNKYDVVHCHNYNGYLWYIFLAALKKIPVRIVHSHSAGKVYERRLSKIVRRLRNILSFEYLITDKIGCSDLATRWLYGDKSIERGKARTIYNGINMDKFSPDNYNKEELKKAYNLKEGTHFIHVGRFSTVKNQMFLLDLFYLIAKQRENVYLHIVGFGPLESSLKKKVKDLHLGEHVTFYKYDTNIPELLSVMDYFLLPSLYEGFPVVALESQAANVPILMSDKITKEVDMGLSLFLPIDSDAKVWADEILNLLKKKPNSMSIELKKRARFDIKNVVKQFEELYTSIH